MSLDRTEAQGLSLRASEHVEVNKQKQQLQQFCCTRRKEENMFEAEARSEVNLGSMIPCFYADGKDSAEEEVLGDKIQERNCMTLWRRHMVHSWMI